MPDAVVYLAGKDISEADAAEEKVGLFAKFRRPKKYQKETRNEPAEGEKALPPVPFLAFSLHNAYRESHGDYWGGLCVPAWLPSSVVYHSVWLGAGDIQQAKPEWVGACERDWGR
jgi:hypothetical protein